MEHNQSSELSLDVKFKVKDILRYNMSVARKNIVNCIVMGIGVGTLIYFFYKLGVSNERLDIAISKNVTLLIVPLIIFMMIPWKVWQITIKQMQQPAFAYGVHYTFNKENIILDLGEVSEAMPWDLFVRIQETTHDFRFYVNAISAQIIPKHNMTLEQIECLRKMIQEASPSKNQLK